MPKQELQSKKICFIKFVLIITLSGTRELGKTASSYTDTFCLLYIYTFSGYHGTSITQTMLLKPPSKTPGAMDRFPLTVNHYWGPMQKIFFYLINKAFEISLCVEKSNIKRWMSHTDSATEFSDDCDLCKLLLCKGSQKLQQNFYSKPNRKQKSRGCSFNRFMNMLLSLVYLLK